MRKTTEKAAGWGGGFLAICLVTLVAVSSVYATNAFDLLRIDPAPRGTATGSYSIALTGKDLGSLQENPAGLAMLEGYRGVASYSDHPLDLSAGYLAAGRSLYQGYAALGITYFNYGEFDRFESVNSEQNGTFSASDFLITAGYGQTLPYVEGLQAGAAVKLLHSTIEDYSSSALALDLGAYWVTGWQGVDVAVVLANLGTQLRTYGGVDESLPMTARAGVAKQLAHLPLQLTATGHYELDDDVFGTLGAEFTVSPMLLLRAGYTTRGSEFHVEGSEDSIAGFSAGIGLNLRKFGIDYAFHSQGAVGQIHKIGISSRF